MVERWPTTAEIVDAVARWTDTDQAELVKGRQGTWRERHARRLLWAALREGRHMSYNEIALCCGGRHHSTVLRGLRDNPPERAVVRGILEDARNGP